MGAPVWLITGAQASGSGEASSTDGLQGWVRFDDADQPEEAARLLTLRYRLSALWSYFDTSAQTPEETVSEILRRQDEALVD